MTHGYNFVKNPVLFVRAVSKSSDENDWGSNDRNINSTQLSGKEAKDFYESVITSSSTSATIITTKRRKKGDVNSKTTKNDVKPSKLALKRAVDGTSKSSFVPTTTCLFKAAESGSLQDVKRIVESKVIDIDCADQFSWTSLMMASHQGHEEIVKYLLIQGAEWEEKFDGSGYDAYDLACMSGHYRIAHMLEHRKTVAREEALESAITRARRIVKRERLWCDICEQHYTASDGKEERSSHHSSITHQFCRSKKEGFTPHSSFYISTDNKGYRMLKDHGWDEKSGLGPSSSGRKYPVKTVLKQDRSGIGCPTSSARVTHYSANDEEAVKRPRKTKLKRLLVSENEKQKDFETKFRRLFY